MPRLTQSKLSAVVGFFRTSSMEIAEAAMDMARDTIRERKANAEKIRAGQKKHQPAAAAASAPAAVAVVKKSHHKKKPITAVAATAGNGASGTSGTVKRGPGRPRKTAAVKAAATQVERRRKPRKHATPAAQERVTSHEAELPLDTAEEVTDDFVPEPEHEFV